MFTGILGRKVGMTQIYSESGESIPVTVLEAGPCPVLGIRTVENDGYSAVQLGYQDKKRPAGNRKRSRSSQASRSERGQVTNRLGSKRQEKRAGQVAPTPKAECEPQKFIREFRGDAPDEIEIGTLVDVSGFHPTLADLPTLLKELAEKNKIDPEDVGWQAQLKKKKPLDYRDCLNSIMSVDVTGTSKGRGYAGVMKRHNFAGQRASHVVKKVHRHAGGTGMSAAPSRLFKGKRMAGQYGNATITTRNLKVAVVDQENNLLLVRGAVPGPNGGYVVIRETNKFN